MAPLIASAKATLTYPLFACAFDPLDSSRLVVGGGGGPGRSGVSNKIVSSNSFNCSGACNKAKQILVQTLLDTSKSTEIEELAQIDLSKDEDSVMSLAVGQRKGKSTFVFAGVNSNPKDVEKGNNKHFRVFGIEAAGKGKGKSSPESAATKITEVSRATLFSGSEKDSYQRITRLSRPYPNLPQLGAVATGMAKESEIVLFDTSSISPPNSRGAFKSNKEAEDVDFIQTGDNEFLVAYCNEHEIYVKEISSKPDEESPRTAYIIPFSDSLEKPTVPQFRSVRWLTKDLILALTNIHSNGGVVLQIFRLPPSGKGQARIVQSHRLPSSITKATGLAVSNLTPPTSPSVEQGYTQFLIAVAGHDSSISLFKVDLQVEGAVSLVTKIKPFRTFKTDHPFSITGITFSNFTPPAHPVTASTPPQYLKLASTGVSNTVIVHTLPLFPVPLSVKRGQSRTPRYVVAIPSGAAALGMGIILSIIAAALIAILVQGFLEIRGAVQPFLNASNYIPTVWQEAIGKPYVFPKDYNQHAGSGYNHHIGVPSDSEDGSALRLPGFFESLKRGDGEKIVIVKDTPEARGGVKAHLHDEKVEGPHGGKTWEELGHEQKEAWKTKLKDAGHWAEGMGETILKGVLFGEVAGAVGQAVGGG